MSEDDTCSGSGTLSVVEYNSCVCKVCGRVFETDNDKYYVLPTHSRRERIRIMITV